MRGFHGPRDYLDAARSPDASPDDLRALALSEYDFVRLAVADHEATPTDVLRTLVPEVVRTWNEQTLLLHLARNRRTPRDALTRIAYLVPPLLHDRDAHQAFGAGVALFQRDDIPQTVLITLLEDPRATTEFRKVVARDTTRPDVREALLLDRSERVRRAAARSS